MKRKLNGPTKSNLSITTKKTLIIFVVFTLFFTISSLAPAELVPELGHFGDFSIALVELERKEDTAILHLAVTKVDDTDSAPDLVPVSLIDDHMNEYSQSFIIDLEGEPATLNALPEGFCYVETVTIPIPKIAPIKKVKVGEKGVNFGDIKLGEPRYLKEYGSTTVTKGQKIQVGKWLSFTMSKIEPALRQWELLVDVENKEYNPLLAEVKVGAQHENGTISWTSSQFNVPAASEFFQKLPLPIPSWTDKGLPYPRALLLLYLDKKSGEQALKLYLMTSDELLPLVGQGPGEIEEVFIEAYQRNGGRKIMGDPVELPHWLAGGDSPKDNRDLLIQNFPMVSQFGRATILWDIQKNADKAYVIHGAARETYMRLGGTESWLGYPNGKVSVSTKGHLIVGFEGGYIGTKDGITFEPYKYPTGKITFAGQRHATTIYTINVDGTNQKKLKYGKSPAWSPDGTKIAFVSYDSKHISIMNADGSNIRVLIELRFDVWSGGIENFNSVDWSPDGRHLVFSKSDLWNIANETWRINTDSSGLLKLTSGKGTYGSNPSWSPDGKTIAFEHSERIDRKACIYLMDSGGGNERILTAGLQPSWSPDGSKIVFIPHTNPRDIYVINKDGTNSTLLMTHSEPVYSVSYSPDSKWLVFSAGSHLYLFGPGNCLFQLKTEGYANHPSWSSQLDLREEVLEKGITSSVDTPKIEPSLQKIKLLSPQNGSTLTLPSVGKILSGDITFSWNSVNNATKYQFILYNRRGQVALDTTKDRTSLTVPLAGGEGTITWKVRAGDNSSNWGSWSSVWSLNLKSTTTINSDSSPQISTATNEDKIEKEITFKIFNYKDDYAEYSIKYPDWPNIPEAKFTHPGLKKSLDIGYPKEVRVHIIISQDFDLMDLFKFLREVPEDLEKEAMKRGKTIEFYMGSTQIIKDEKTDNGNFMELLLDLDGEFFKKNKEDINAFLNSSKLHVLFKDFYCKENNKYFSVSVTVAEDKWSKYQNIAKSIINSMKVIKITESSSQISETTYSLTGSLHCPDKRGYPCNSCGPPPDYKNHFKGFNVLTTDEDCYVKLTYNDGDYIGNQNNCEVTIKGEKWLGLENESGTELVEEINKGNFDFKRANKFVERTMNFPGDNYKYEFADNGKEFRLYLSRNRAEAFKAVPWQNITVEIKNKETDKVFKYKFQKGIFPQAYSWSNGVANYGQCVWWTAKRWVEEVDSKTLFPFYPPSSQGFNVIKIDSNYQPKRFDILIDYDPRQTGELGHYGFVEKIEGDKMYISQFNWIKPGEVYNYIIRTWNGNATNLFYPYNPSDEYYFKYYYRK